jgi:hypothetical protein
MRLGVDVVVCCFSNQEPTHDHVMMQTVIGYKRAV